MGQHEREREQERRQRQDKVQAGPWDSPPPALSGHSPGVCLGLLAAGCLLAGFSVDLPIDLTLGCRSESGLVWMWGALLGDRDLDWVLGMFCSSEVAGHGIDLRPC